MSKFSALVVALVLLLAPMPALAQNTLTLPSTTTAYTAGELIANSATATSVVVPYFSVAPGEKIISGVRLSTNDATSTAWGAKPVIVGPAGIVLTQPPAALVPPGVGLVPTAIKLLQ